MGVDRFCNIRGTDGRPVPGRAEAVEITQDPASAAECERLQLRSKEAVWRIRRVRRYQGRALMCESVSLPAQPFPDLGGRGDDSRIVVLAQQYGLLLGAAEERISIGAASPQAARAFDIAQGSPIIVLDRVVRTIEGRPVEWRVWQCHLATNYYLARMR